MWESQREPGPINGLHLNSSLLTCKVASVEQQDLLIVKEWLWFCLVVLVSQRETCCRMALCQLDKHITEHAGKSQNECPRSLPLVSWNVVQGTDTTLAFPLFWVVVLLNCSVLVMSPPESWTAYLFFFFFMDIISLQFPNSGCEMCVYQNEACPCSLYTGWTLPTSTWMNYSVSVEGVWKKKTFCCSMYYITSIHLSDRGCFWRIEKFKDAAVALW